MTIYLGADHRGFEQKETLKKRLQKAGHTVTDLGNAVHDPDDDYVDFAAAVAQKVGRSTGSRGVVFCGSGVGVSIAADKIKGIRTALALSREQVIDARKHDDINVLAIAADFTDEANTEALVDAFLNTPFDGGERYRRRIGKIAALER